MNLPSTKRFLYDVILKWYEDSIKENLFRTNFCYTFHGVRRIGKTILLKQLNYEISNSKYYDCSDYQDNERDLVADMDNDCARGISVFLLDEICKYPDLSYLIDTIKMCGSDRTFIITGSTSKFVQNIGYKICSGPIVYLPPITYCEWLCWGNKCDYVNSLKITNESVFLDYIKNGTSNVISDPAEYIRSVVDDTLTSYKARSKKKDINEKTEIDYSLLTKLMEYMALVNTSEIEDNGNYTKITTFFIENNDEKIRIKELIKEYNNLIKNNKTCEITKYMHLLTDSGLLNSIVSYYKEPIDNNILENKYHIFRYPQYAYAILKYNSFDNLYYSHIIENKLIDSVATYYNYSGKYRDRDQLEIDICYTIDASMYGIEVKCRPIDKINVEHYEYVAKNINLKDICFTATDLNSSYLKKDNYYVMRPDILMLLVELEYFSQSPRKMTIPQIISKYLT